MARGQSAATGEPTDWVTRAADAAIRHAGEGNLVTCASGISPSGPIHLGNLREFLTVHFVAEEVRRRGASRSGTCRVGTTTTGSARSRTASTRRGTNTSAGHSPPSPIPWECHESWAEHFKAPLRAALVEMGCEMYEVNQTEMYTAGAYRDQILEVVRRRHEIDEVLGRYRTKEEEPSDDGS